MAVGMLSKFIKNMAVSGDIQDFAENCMKELERKIDDLNTLNIIIMGKTGVGKSTLINSIFGKEIAQVGIGEPVTENIRKYFSKDLPLAIYDTVGIELRRDTQEKTFNQINEVVQKGENSGNISEAIHCIWYCVNVASSRFEKFEENLIKEIAEKNNIPIILIMTQAVRYNKETGKGKRTKELQKCIESINLPIKRVIPVMSEYDVDTKTEPYGLDTVVEVTEEVIPDEIKDALIHAEKVYLKPKLKKAQISVAGACTAAATVGFVPIPFADSAALVPIQITMIASITAAFGLKLEKAKMTSIIASIIGTTGASVGGKAIVSGLLKCIPGVGTVLGGTISAGTASAITAILGEAYIQLMILIFKGEFNLADVTTKKGKKKIAELMKEAAHKNPLKDEDKAMLTEIN